MTDAPAPDPRRWKALAILSVAYLMVVLDTAIVNVALPTIQEELDFSPENLQWVVSGYALTFGGLLLLGGRLGDILGRRKVFMAGLLLFAAFSLLCGLSQNDTMLIVARLLQGAAGAILSPSVFSIVSVTFAEGSERNKALGILGAIAGSGAAIGVLLGGVLTTYAGWEWIFIVNVPIGIAALLIVPKLVQESRADGMARTFDAGGAITVTAGLMLLVYGLTQSSEAGWGSGQVIGTLVGAAVLIALFLLIETRSKSPLMPLSIFRRRQISGANVVGLGLGTAVFGTFYLLSLYMGQVLGFSALKTGVGYLAIALSVIVSAGVAQGVVTKVGVKPALMFGLSLIAGGLVYLSFVSVGGSYFGDLFIGFLLVGIGMGFAFIPISIAALSGIESHEAGLASGLINTSQNVGGALGLAILVTVSTTRLNNELAGVAEPTPAQFGSALVSGTSIAFWVAFAFIVGSLVIAGLMLKRESLAGKPVGVHIG